MPSYLGAKSESSSLRKKQLVIKVAARSFQLIVMVFANSRKGHAKHFQSLSAQLP
jgi:hypothetical protein